ncbi:MAG TPA: DUF1080 domain-containing protein [Planctomycetaceae bacterium]|nr:DUF1080 domain-containing protein [Planctomycetaceae bacterium]
MLTAGRDERREVADQEADGRLRCHRQTIFDLSVAHPAPESLTETADATPFFKDLLETTRCSRQTDQHGCAPIRPQFDCPFSSRPDSFPMRSSVALLILLLVPTTSFAQDKPFVSADPGNVDEDFPFQGEYSGLILPDDGRTAGLERIGVQVIALGNGEFDAVVFNHGLPGAGWDKSEKQRLKGSRNGDTVILTGETLTGEITAGHLLLKSYRGYNLGRFPRVVRTSPTLGCRAPRNAIVLFDGSDADEFTNGRVTENNLLMEGADFKRTFEDFTLHVEFRLPYMPNSRGQKRSNSGVYLQSRYEVQVLDSFGLEGAFNECGALYRYQVPDINMCLPPLQWQTYDITFRSPRFDEEGKKIKNARLTVRHNGVLIHNNFNVERKTGAGKPESPEAFPIRLQNHSDPVRFRNIWVVEH